MFKKIIILCLISIYSCLAYTMPPKVEKITILLNAMPNSTHAPLVIAKQLGYYQEQGLEVSFQTPTNPREMSELLAEKKADIGLMSEPVFMEQMDQGLPIARIGTLIDKPLNCIIALKQSGIKDITDLKNKDIGETKNQLKNALLIAMLHNGGLNEHDYKLIPMNTSLTDALLSHKVDAISGLTRNVEVVNLEKSGKKLTVFFPEEHGTPTYSEIVFITHTKNTNDPRYARFLIALKKAVRYMDEHPELAWQFFTKEYPDLNHTLDKQYWFNTLPYFAENPAEINGDDWKNLAEFMRRHHFIKNTPTAVSKIG